MPNTTPRSTTRTEFIERVGRGCWAVVPLCGNPPLGTPGEFFHAGKSLPIPISVAVSPKSPGYSPRCLFSSRTPPIGTVSAMGRWSSSSPACPPVAGVGGSERRGEQRCIWLAVWALFHKASTHGYGGTPRMTCAPVFRNHAPKSAPVCGWNVANSTARYRTTRTSFS